MNLPEQVKNIFYNYLDGEITLSEFEQWIYKNTNQLDAVSKELQFELINFDYNQYNSNDKILGFIYYSVIDIREYTEWRLKKLLALTLNKNNWTSAIGPLYWEFWDDNSRFNFLLPISNLIAVVILKPENFGLPNLHGKLKEEIIIEFIYPEILIESEQLLNDINSGLIQITGEKEFTDNRINKTIKMTFQEILEKIQIRMKE